MKQLGKLLIEEDMLTQEQLDQALAMQKTDGGKLGTCLVKLGILTEESLHYFVAVQLGIEFIELQSAEIPPETIRLINKEVAGRYQVLPWTRSDSTLTVACSDPSDPKLFRLREDLLLDSKVEIAYCVSTESGIRDALAKYYGINASASAGQASHGASNGSGPAPTVDESKDIAESEKLLNPELLSEGEGQVESTGPAEDEYDENKADDAPVIRLVNSIISTAVAKGASDIHLNPFEKSLVVRYRTDGALQVQSTPPAKYRRAMIARLKVMAKLDIMEKRKPQDGRIKIKVQGKVIDLRVSTLPTIYGENVVMRILDQESLQLDLAKLGFEPEELAVYTEAIRKPYGMVLHTGPTGSGKTTTLYSALSTINDPSKNVMTIEDPVEYNLPGVIQVQINAEVGLSFAEALRSNIRQDPNICMVGEIRDGETAQIAITAALTGHLVLSTLHTNTAPATIMRLVDMGIDPMYVGSAILIVVAQRLIRRICKECKEPYIPTDDDLTRLVMKRQDIEGAVICKGRGCSVCGGSGYKGRVALYEIMRITPRVEQAIYDRTDLNTLTDIAIAEGMATLRMVAVKKWKAGMTSLDEIVAMTASDG
jgi:type IV pilus assembly protein PilB